MKFSTKTVLVLFLVIVVFTVIVLDTPKNFQFKVFSVGNFTSSSTLLVNEINEENSYITNKEKILFVGDLMLARDVERKMVNQGPNYPFQGFAIDTAKSYAVANFESTIPEKHILTPNNTFQFSTKVEYLTNVRQAGFTHASLANNHSFDYGLAGYNHTISKMWDNDLIPFGHPTIVATSAVVILEVSTQRVAIIGVNITFGQPNEASLKSILSYANSISDIQIVYLHWGNEYEENQSAAQRALALFLSNIGADLIIGHHPHVVQGVEVVNNTLVFYSLGNFIFDQYFSTLVQQGLAIELDFKEKVSISLLPVTSMENRNQPRLMAEAERQSFLEALSLRSSPALRSQIQTGLIDFSVLLASSTEVAIMGE